VRTRRRYSIALAFAAAGVLAVSGIAVAGVASNGNDSSTGLGVVPSTLPKQEFKKVRLDVMTSTEYEDPGNSIPGGATERAQLNFDDDIKVVPSAKPKCNPADISGNATFPQAMAACGSSLVGDGEAMATANGNFDVPACVLLFNGKPKNDRPTVLVFTRAQVAPPPANTIDCDDSNPGNTTVLLQGILKKIRDPNNTNDFGTQLDFNNITDAADLPLTLFDTQVFKASGFTKARCRDRNKVLNLKTTFTYNDGVKEVAKDPQACLVA
jgi:hypothetical protein